MGLGEFIPARGGERFKRSFDLEEIGIEVELPASRMEKPNTEKQKARPNEGSLEDLQKKSESDNPQELESQQNKPESQVS